MTSTGRLERVLVLGAIAVLGAVLLAADALAQKDRTSLISRQSASAGGLGGDDESFNPATSANGRFVAFESHADNLGGPAADVCQHLRLRPRAQEGRAGVAPVEERRRRRGRRRQLPPVDLRRAAGTSRSKPTRTTSAGPPVDVSQIYLYDRQRDRIRLVSRQSQSAGGAAGDDGSFNGVVAGNGRFVAFETNADNLGGPIADFSTSTSTTSSARR